MKLGLLEWVFFDADSHEGSPVGTRTIIERVPTGLVFEVFGRNFDLLRPMDSTKYHRFLNYECT